MYIMREKKPGSDIREISYLYSRLQAAFNQIAESLFRWSHKREDVFLEVGETPLEQASTALLEIKRTLEKLQSVNRKFKFDNRALEKRYRDELELCQATIAGMITSLNDIWRRGQPGRREVPFGSTTNFRFVFNSLVRYINIANDESNKINKKAATFNRANKDLPPLPVLKMMTAPAWTRNI